MENIGIILIAGSSTRLIKDISVKKQFYKLNGKESFLYSLETFINSKLFKKIYLTIDKTDLELVNSILKRQNYDFDIKIVYGGDNRLISTFNTLKAIKEDNLTSSYVFIHDGARPCVSIDLLNRLYNQVIKTNSAIPYLDIYNSMYSIKDNTYVQRKDFIQIQTPQVFSFDLIYNSYLNIDLSNTSFLDEGSVLKYNNEDISFVKGDLFNIKLTDISSLKLIERLLK